MPYTMFDSVNAAAFPPDGFNVTAGYVAGRYPSSAAIRARFPNIPHVTIAVTARQDADCLDVEPGDATPDEAPVWYDRQRARGVAVPIIYCMASWVGAVRAAMGSRDYLLWSAHYNGRPHICGTDPSCNYPQADATQWADHGPRGENVDQSLLSDHFYATITSGDDMPSSQEVAQAVWDYPLERGGIGPAAIWAWVGDNRIISESVFNLLATHTQRTDALIAALEAATKNPELTADEISKLFDAALARAAGAGVTANVTLETIK